MWTRIYPHAVLLMLANIILRASCKGSLTFLIDDTGSMHNDIRQVRSSVDRISNIVFNEKSSLISNMVLVTFNDPDAQVRAVTENRNTFKRTLNAVYAEGGGDCWEPSMKGLLLALSKSNSNSYIYVFTDASAKDYRDARYVKEMCQKKQSQIVFVLTGHCYDYDAAAFDVYFDIAHACSGLAFDVSKTDVEEVLRTIEETIKGNKTVITSTIVPAGVTKNIPFTIDDHTDYAIVSVSGRNVYLKIRGPSANLEKIMWNNNGKVIKLSNAKPGQYVASVMGQTRTSVVIVGRTDFFFTHGFSKLKPKSLGDTSLQPIANANVHLSISITDDHHSVNIVSAQILDMNENPMKSLLPLTEISKDFYVTDQFVAPSQRFKIAVNGRVKATGKAIKRIVKIPITPSEPPKTLPTYIKPTVEITEGKAIEIEYNSTVKLTCKVVAFPEPKIEWINMNAGRMPSKMSLQEYPYKYISYMDISYASKGDRYKCFAVNDVGRDERTISVFVKEPFTVKSVPSGITKLAYGTEGTITCDVTSRLPMDIHWFYANEITGQTRQIETSDKYVVSASRTKLTIKKMDLDLVGRYTCKVTLKNKKNVGKSFITRVKIDGLISPKVQGGIGIKVTKGKTAIFECKVVSGLPAPKITWLFGGKSGSTFTHLAGSESVLRITNVEDKHEGKYKCVAKNVAGKDEHVTTLFVQDLPKITTKSSMVYQATEGDAVLRIPCVAAGVPKPVIVWKLSGRYITPSAKYYLEDGSLIINNPTVSDTNSYTCEAQNEVGAVSATFRTYIRQAPRVSGVTAKKVRLGMPASIECTVEGKPKPTITWQFMDNSGSKFLPILGADTVLQISRVENKHAGRYKCVAKNEVRSNEHITTLEVQDMPNIVSSVSTIYQSTVGDALLRIPCVAGGLPKPSITWKLNGHVINPSAKYSIEDGTLIIRNPKVSDTNSYTCEAKNEVGAVSATFRTYIRQAPQVSGVTAKKVRLGMPASIECTVEGKPKPTITWQFMDNSGSKFLTIPGSDTVLHISRAENKHAGRYKCVAKNEVRSNEHITTLEVQDMPNIVSNVSTIYQSTEGDASLRIPCVAGGLPKPSITWKLNDHVINPSAKYSIEDGTLIIRNPSVSDTNSYTCEAKNEVGAVSATFRTYIRQLPKLSGLASKNVRLATPASIECFIIKGEPKPKITWQFMDTSVSKYVPIAGSENILRISSAKKTHAGSYKCVAQNNLGSDEHVTTLIVDFAPEIIKNSLTVEGIEGDLALRIPCDVVGIPKPVITWKLKGATITPDSKYLIEDGALVIMKPTEKDSSLYTCEAKNYINTVSTTFRATVETLPTNFGTEHFVYLLRGETRKLKCDAYSSPSQSVKWFITKVRPRTTDSWLSTTPSPPKLGSPETTTASSIDYSSTPSPTITEDAGITEPYIQISNASSTHHDGNYTCRVSDKRGNTHTHTYVVDVGSAPQFRYGASSLNSWGGDVSKITQNCDILDNTKPKPVVEWKFNGKVLTDLNSAGLGHYTCNVSNVHGSVLKRFDVKSSACLITRNWGNANMQYLPLVLDDKGFWHKLENTKQYTVLAQEHKITLSCPSQKETSNIFKNFPKKSTLEAFCYKEDSFLVEGNIYKLSDLQCTNSIQPSVVRKKVKCSTETSELMRVGYNVNGFLEAYEVCFDTEKNMPLYTRIIMTETNNNGLSTGYNWYTYPGIGRKTTERGFNCSDTMSSCCYSKSQLVNAIDFNDGPAKKSTFIDPLNIIPVWLPCNTSKPSWESINEMVRSKLPLYIDIVTWSGTHTFQEKNGAIVPRYLWKVVRLNDDEAVAIVHVNDPEPVKNDIKCKKSVICDNQEWFISSDKYTYCCSLPDFFESFDIHVADIGESLEAALDKINKST